MAAIFTASLRAQPPSDPVPVEDTTSAADEELPGLPSDDVEPPPGLPSDDIGPPLTPYPDSESLTGPTADDTVDLEKALPGNEGVLPGEPDLSEPDVIEEPRGETITVVEPADSDPDIGVSPEDEGELVELETDVVIGYGTTKKKDLTGAVSTVKSEAISRDAVYSVRKALQGKATGVHVTQNSGAPGKAVTVRIRGVGTINNSDPFYVLDGVPVNGIDFLNPNDIESISILKDASATAIYGSRGANGVVLVTTKKPKAGESWVSYDFSIGRQEPWKTPSLVNAEEWAILRNEAMRAANLPVDNELSDPSGLGEGTDWFGEVTRPNALMQQHNVSMARGAENLKYYVSANHFVQEGVIKGSGLQKNAVRFNAENKVSNWFTLGNNLGVTQTQTRLTDESDEWNSLLVNTIAMDPVTQPRDAQGNLVPSEFNNIKNPVGIIENTNDEVKSTAITGTLYATTDVFNIFEYKSIFGLDMVLNDTSGFTPKYFISASDNQANAVVSRGNLKDYMLVFENYLTYETSFLSDNMAKFMLGATAQERNWERVSARNNSTPSNSTSLRYLDATTGNNPTVGGLEGGNSLASFYGRTEINFLDKYLLTSSFRTDGSSRFGLNKRWTYLPSGAAAWRISQEPFLKNLDFIEDLKLRVGWGQTGNQEIPDYLFTTTTSDGQNYVFGNQIVPGATYLSSGNPEIKWETQEALNGGVDLTLFGGRIEFIGDIFVKKTKDMLLRPTIPYMAGLQTSPMVNKGSLENRGMELALNYREKIGGFTSTIGMNFATYDNKILGLDENAAAISDAPFRNAGFVTRTEVGHSIGQFYGYKTDGLFQNQAEIDAFTYVDPVDGNTQLVQPNAAPGDIKYRDEDGDGEWDKGYIGSPHPDFIYGLTWEVAWLGFDLNASLQGVYGNEIFNGGRWYTDNGTAFFNLDERMLNRWTGEGTTNDVNLPRMNNNDANNMLISDRFIEDGSFMRVKSTQIGYTLSNSLLRRARIKRCRFYAGVENLYTFTKYKGLEPEVGLGEERGGTQNSSLTMGVDRTTYPQARTYLMGLNLTI